jgi:hypothetical protein
MRIQYLLLFPVLAGCRHDPSALGGFERFEGGWTGTTQGKTLSETWTIADGRMYGKGYLMNGPDTLFSEKLVVEWVNDKLVYIADVRGQDPVIFTAKEKEKNFRFENREHDFPQQITYTPKGENELLILLEGTENNQPIKKEIFFRRQL